nr:MAG TPA: hypothetical protein [Caudoviricetes sp.]
MPTVCPFMYINGKTPVFVPGLLCLSIPTFVFPV